MTKRSVFVWIIDTNYTPWKIKNVRILSTFRKKAGVRRSPHYFWIALLLKLFIKVTKQPDFDHFLQWLSHYKLYAMILFHTVPSPYWTIITNSQENVSVFGESCLPNRWHAFLMGKFNDPATVQNNTLQQRNTENLVKNHKSSDNYISIATE